jgi:hypothetical protein
MLHPRPNVVDYKVESIIKHLQQMLATLEILNRSPLPAHIIVAPKRSKEMLGSL